MPGIGKQIIKKGSNPKALQIGYNNTTSGLSSNNVQAAIDESVNLSIALAVAL